MPKYKPIIAYSNAASRFALCWLLMVAVHGAQGQKQADNWCFGQHVWVSFSKGSPVAAGTSTINTREGCCTISDADGNLLFYSDGVQVWNKNHAQMLNGFGLLGNSSSTQSSIVIPKPGSNRYYYLFTVSDCNTNTGFCYSLIDMQLDAGLGGVVATEKNILLQTDVTEKVTAVLHANNSDIWVVTHERNNSIFDAFLVTSAGVNSIAIKSTAGSVHPGIQPWLGYLKASSNGQHLACAVYSMSDFNELFDFDPSTGVISNPIKFTQNINGPYGIEFSPNSQLLYMGNFNNGKLFQVSLASGDSATIVASQTLIANQYSGMGALQTGSDGKIYIVVENSTYLHEISNPDIPGTGCGFHANTVFLGGNVAKLGLPTFIQSYFNPVPFTYKNVCFGDTTEFIPESTTGIDSLLWNFGDPASVPNDTSSLFSPVHVFTAPGTFSVSLTSWAGGVSATETQDVKINPLPQPFLGADTTLCGGNALVLNAGEGYTAYLWNDGSTAKNLVVTTNGSYTVTVTDGNGCQGSDGIQVEFHAVPGPAIIKHN